ncbi:hypothetical protein CkaCkLH20_06841 [Colletotrichum karsti]|uniref:Uncharacterized protein n=1 Tax=Colletotrichum karsti TaxID=1095194 RepID=A0A9P6LH51_9PEZI|nr:uncharacterized protein CkaCkLH20_06841 [Colletotrichum karsti]KAF9875909.1 hypothetical protein CkaCkLH20_06841 [Colletotrichum karsti]
MGFVPKRELDAVDAVEISPKRHQPGLDENSTEGILSRITLPDLKSCFQDLLADPLCGPFIEAQLHTYADKSWDAERERVKQQAQQIGGQAESAIAKVIRQTEKLRTAANVSDRGNAVAPLLQPTYDLWQLGQRLNGPTLAFDLLMNFVEMIIQPDDGEYEPSGDFDDNDHVHCEIESILVGIAYEDRHRYAEAADWTSQEQTANRRRVVDKLNKSITDSSGTYQYSTLSMLLFNGKIDGTMPPINVGHFCQRPRWQGGEIVGYYDIPSAIYTIDSDSEDGFW